MNTPFWKDAYNAPIPNKLKLILDETNKISVTNDTDLISAFELYDWKENELTFFVQNYNTIFKKNKKGISKSLI